MHEPQLHPTSKPRRSKFGVRMDPEGVAKRTYKGVKYDSQFECDYAKSLDFRVKAHEIERWEYHPLKIPLNAEGGKRVATYTPDFRVFYYDEPPELIETKGRKTPLFNRTMAHMKAQYPESTHPDLQITIVQQEKKKK